MTIQEAIRRATQNERVENLVNSRGITYTATINFTAGDTEQARRTFEAMREAFCNDNSIREIFSTLQSEDTRGNCEALQLYTNPTSLPTKQTHSAPLHTVGSLVRQRYAEGKGETTEVTIEMDHPAHTCQDRPHVTCDACEIVGKQ